MNRKFLTVRNLKPSPHSVIARLPDVYNNYLNELKKTPSPVHYIPETIKWKVHPISKQRMRVENVPIPLIFPKEADKGIWGGEGVVKGFRKIKLKRRRNPNYWFPELKQSVLYSEILNEYMKITVTERALRLIDQCCGFDNYILSTPVQDLKSQLALDIRRKMLLALINNKMYPDDDEKNQEVLEKYKKFMIPKEEAEWFGLSMRAAIQKQKLLEEETMKPLPLKYQFRAKLIQELKAAKGENQSEEGSEKSGFSSWISRLNPFMSKT